MFSTPKIPKNDARDPLFTELLIYHHGGHDLHDLYDMEFDNMYNMSSKLDLAHLKCLKMTPNTQYLRIC